MTKKSWHDVFLILISVAVILDVFQAVTTDALYRHILYGFTSAILLSVLVYALYKRFIGKELWP